MTDDRIREWATKLARTVESKPFVLESAARVLVDEVIEEIEAKLKSVPRAHTYASENADLYRGFDNGIAHALKIVQSAKGKPR